jgi:PhnB protein
MMRNTESPEPHAPGALPAGTERKIVHAAFRVGDTTILASDGMCSGTPTFQGVSLALEVENDAEAEPLREPRRGRHGALGDQGAAPVTSRSWRPRFWMVIETSSPADR